MGKNHSFFKEKFKRLFRYVKKNEQKLKNLAKRVYYIPNKIKPLNFKKIMNDVAEYSYNKVIMMAYNKTPLKYVEYYNLDNEKNINVICNLDQEINAEGIENINNILDNKLKYYKN